MKKKKKITVYHGEKNISGDKVASVLKKLKIPFAMISAEEIASGGLRNYAAVIFPGGHSIVLGKKGDSQTMSFVKGGGGFIGICAGNQFGAKLKILPVKLKILRAAGIFDMRIVRKHPVTRGYVVAGKHPAGRKWKYSHGGRVRIRYNNGGILETRRGANVVVSFDEEGTLGAIVAGKIGKGRVVLISPHPESTPPAPKGKGASDSDRSQEPLKLFRNAVRYVMGGPALRAKPGPNTGGGRRASRQRALKRSGSL